MEARTDRKNHLPPKTHLPTGPFPPHSRGARPPQPTPRRHNDAPTRLNPPRRAAHAPAQASGRLGICGVSPPPPQVRWGERVGRRGCGGAAIPCRRWVRGLFVTAALLAVRRPWCMRLPWERPASGRGAGGAAPVAGGSRPPLGLAARPGARRRCQRGWGGRVSSRAGCLAGPRSGECRGFVRFPFFVNDFFRISRSWESVGCELLLAAVVILVINR